MGFQDALLVSFDEKSAAFNDGSLCALFRFTEKASQVAIRTATARLSGQIILWYEEGVHLCISELSIRACECSRLAGSSLQAQ